MVRGATLKLCEYMAAILLMIVFVWAVISSTDASLDHNRKGVRSSATLSTPPPVAVHGNYFVSPLGDDKNPGTEALPFRTLQKGADVVNAGETVIVEDGTYTYLNGGTTTNKNIVEINRGGFAGRLVTFKSRNPWGARLDGERRADTGFKLRASFIRIEGFEIVNLISNGNSSSGVEIYSAGAFSQVIGNHIHDIGRQCTDTTNGLVGIFVQQSNVLIEGNLIHDIGRYATGENNCSNSTTNYQNHDHGIYLTGNISDVMVRNNVFYNTNKGWSIQIFKGRMSRVGIFNNTFSGMNPHRNGQIVIHTVTLVDSEIENNKFYQPRNAAVAVATGGAAFTNTVISNNTTDTANITDAFPAGLIIFKNLTQHVH